MRIRTEKRFKYLAAMPVWDDLRFPLTGRNLDTTTGRLAFDYYNGTVVFASNARFALSETVSFTAQIPHAWAEETPLSPHIHWLQQSANVPNWLLGYRVLPLESTQTALATDFSLHTLAIPERQAFEYTGDVLEQITAFPKMEMRGCQISDTIHFCLWRDSANASGLFAGADPSSDDEHVREFDVHIQKNAQGSIHEFRR